MHSGWTCIGTHVRRVFSKYQLTDFSNQSACFYLYTISNSRHCYPHWCTPLWYRDWTTSTQCCTASLTNWPTSYGWCRIRQPEWSWDRANVHQHFVLIALHWIRVRWRVQYKLLVFAALHSLAPECIADLLPPHHLHTTSGTDALLLKFKNLPRTHVLQWLYASVSEICFTNVGINKIIIGLS